MLAAAGGRLSDAAPCANPHAPRFYGISAIFRRGHGLAAPEDGGCGAALCFGGGAVSGSAGLFCRPLPGEQETPWDTARCRLMPKVSVQINAAGFHVFVFWKLQALWAAPP
jgi:hypothetical protein